MRQKKPSFNHSKTEIISNNGEVKLKIEQVRIQTRWRKNKRKIMDGIRK